MAQTPDPPNDTPPVAAAESTAPPDQFLLAPAPRRSLFNDLFGETLSDARRLGSTRTMQALALGMLVARVTHMADRPVSSGMSGSTALGRPFAPGETLGGARMQFGGAFATYMIGRVTRSDTIANAGSDLVHAQLLTQALTTGIKMSVRRTRPDGTEYSFPSGHTSTSFASATVLQRHFGWKVGIPAYAFASYVAASRVQVKRHYLSDVTFGAALGILVGRTVTIGRGDARFAVSPTATAGGAAVHFTLLDKR